MYRIAIVHKGQPAQRSTCAPEDLFDTVCGVIKSQGSTVTDKDQTGVTAMVRDARAMADADGFAALEIGSAAVTIRPHAA